VTPLLRYSILRLGLFFGTTAALALAGARGVLLVGLAIAISLALSYVLLRGAREDLAQHLTEHVARRRAGTLEPASSFGRGIAADAAAEDAAAEDAAAGDAAAGGTTVDPAVSRAPEGPPAAPS
jgi:hypothetical protein